MAYAGLQDVIDLHGVEHTALMADRDDDGQPDAAAFAQALELASNEIDSRLSIRYGVPLNPVPAMVKVAAIEIAMYRLANDPNKLTDDIRKRYEDTIKWLSDVASGKANVGVPALDDIAEKGDADWSAPVARWGKVSR